MQVILSGMLMHYERAGTGKTILIVPGWADTSVSWRAVQKLLQSDFDVVVLDLPGFGGTDAPAKAWGLGDYGRFVQEFLAKISADKLYAVIGHSNGGAIAIKALAEHMIHADKLVLVASAGIRAKGGGRKALFKTAAKVGKAASAPLPRSIKQKLRARFYAAAGSDLLVAEHMQETFKQIVSEDVQPLAKEVKVPTYLLYGDNDTATPLSFGETYHRLIAGSKLEVLHGSDHFLHVNQPEVVAEKIRGYLR